jgi:hypothetical protein
MRLLTYKTINTSSIIKTKYRVVTPEFYNNSLDIIKSWKSFSNYSKYRSEKKVEDKYEVINNEAKIYFSNQTSLAIYLNTTHQRISQIINLLKNQQVKSYYHKKTRSYIQLIKNNH